VVTASTSALPSGNEWVNDTILSCIEMRRALVNIESRHRKGPLASSVRSPAHIRSWVFGGFPSGSNRLHRRRDTADNRGALRGRSRRAASNGAQDHTPPLRDSPAVRFRLLGDSQSRRGSKTKSRSKPRIPTAAAMVEVTGAQHSPQGVTHECPAKIDESFGEEV